jgi:hypothetical protein
MNEKQFRKKLEIYGPPIVIENKIDFYTRKFKREFSYCKSFIFYITISFFNFLGTSAIL